MHLDHNKNVSSITRICSVIASPRKLRFIRYSSPTKVRTRPSFSTIVFKEHSYASRCFATALIFSVNGWEVRRQPTPPPASADGSAYLVSLELTRSKLRATVRSFLDKCLELICYVSFTLTCILKLKLTKGINCSNFTRACSQNPSM